MAGPLIRRGTRCLLRHYNGPPPALAAALPPAQILQAGPLRQRERQYTNVYNRNVPSNNVYNRNGNKGRNLSSARNNSFNIKIGNKGRNLSNARNNSFSVKSGNKGRNLSSARNNSFSANSNKGR